MRKAKTIKKLLYLFLVVNTAYSYGQKESLRAIGFSNSETQSEVVNLKSAKLSSAVAVTRELPFIDDFSNYNQFPDQSKWVTDDTYINNNMGRNTLTIGVATMDAVDKMGHYRQSGLGDVLPGDELESVPVNVSSASNVYMSFLYQAGGNGDAPEENDSLILQFYDNDSTEWVTVWKALHFSEEAVVAEISGVDTLIWEPEPNEFNKIEKTDTVIYSPITATTTQFKYVILPISGTGFETDSFKFRFVNHYSLNEASYEGKISNADFWNIDYVKIDGNRSPSENAINDLAVVGEVDSILKNYTALPANHFCTPKGQSNWIGSPKYTLRNNYDKNILFSRTVMLRDEYLSVEKSVNIGIDSIKAGSVLSLKDNLPPSIDKMKNYMINSCLDSGLFTFKYIVETLPNSAQADDYKWNDTIEQEFKLSYYYAYDDGTPEWGYGITGQSTRQAKVAVRFESYVEDTLKGADILFNRPFGNVSTYFKLCVWDDNGGRPGRLLHSVEHNTDFQDSINMFGFFSFPDTVEIVVDGNFFIGWEQMKEGFINIGFDTHFNNAPKNFVNLGSGWQNSTLQGSLLIRPVFRNETPPTVGQEILQEVKPELNVYPNPAKQYLNIEMESVNGEAIPYSISDVQGRIVARGNTYGQIDCSELKKGIYFFSFNVNNYIIHKKIIIAGKY